MSTATNIKAAEAGIDMVDASISSMSMTYGHSATESVVAILEGTDRDTGLDLNLLEEIASYFREVRKKYARYEGALKGVDSRILVAQVPGGMLTNMENQLREQGASDKLDEVLKEIPRVREDLGFIPLVTPTSQIVGTQAVLNVMTGERYKSIAKETAGILKGEYGAAPAPVNKELQERVLEGKQPITCRPADLLEPEFGKLRQELKGIADERKIRLADNLDDDVLIYAQFQQVGLKFLENRGNPDAFEPVPEAGDVAPAAKTAAPAPSGGPEAYTVSVNGVSYNVVVAPGGEITDVTPAAPAATPAPVASGGATIDAQLAGNVFKINVVEGQAVNEGDVVIILEAMKMETEVRTSCAGTIASIHVREGDSVHVGDTLVTLA
jgi:oxaloacetate decarboxylase alpha subunit